MKIGRRWKWTLVITAILLVGGGGMALLGHKSVHAELVIPAQPEAVWAVIADASAYREWNPVIVRVEGAYAPGAELTNHVVDASGTESVMKSKVLGMTAQRELNQGGGFPGILTFNHRWTLEPVEGGTRVVQHEEYRGIGVWFWDPSWFESAYQNALEALRARVEALASK